MLDIDKFSICRISALFEPYSFFLDLSSLSLLSGTTISLTDNRFITPSIHLTRVFCLQPKVMTLNSGGTVDNSASKAIL